MSYMMEVSIASGWILHAPPEDQLTPVHCTRFSNRHLEVVKNASSGRQNNPVVLLTTNIDGFCDALENITQVGMSSRDVDMLEAFIERMRVVGVEVNTEKETLFIEWGEYSQ